MKTKKLKELEIEISGECYDYLRAIAKKSGLKIAQVVDIILRCELDVTRNAVRIRRSAAKKLKIKPTIKFLYRDLVYGLKG